LERSGDKNMVIKAFCSTPEHNGSSQHDTAEKPGAGCTAV